MKIAIIYLCLFTALPTVQQDHFSVTDGKKEILQVNRKEFEVDYIGSPFVDSSKTNNLLQKLDQQISEKPVQAKIGQSNEIIPGQAGYKLNRKEFMEQFYRYFYDSGAEELEVPKLPVHPKVDSELLANIRTQQIGHYVTYFNSNNKERSHNIRLASEAIDSHVVFPGEVFSFNKVVGKRTKEKGYQNAPVIVRGEVEEGIGGGICQVSSTLFNSVDKAGVKVLERYSHSRQVPYVPPGRDATVSWYGPDFTFKNPYNQPLLIRTRVSGGQMSVTVYSSDVINIKSKNVLHERKNLSIH
ncbi:VanW family protein [Halobacillus litoralis]|uniref:VanW family protein n=1 Tax=Halobacillus litoralis TaxID=45668 RepID=UPI001CFDC714|nr:VanW family protein [Halobacillus litoralis]